MLHRQIGDGLADGAFAPGPTFGLEFGLLDSLFPAHQLDKLVESHGRFHWLDWLERSPAELGITQQTPSIHTALQVTALAFRSRRINKLAKSWHRLFCSLAKVLEAALGAHPLTLVLAQIAGMA